MAERYAVEIAVTRTYTYFVIAEDEEAARKKALEKRPVWEAGCYGEDKFIGEFFGGEYYGEEQDHTAEHIQTRTILEYADDNDWDDKMRKEYWVS